MRTTEELLALHKPVLKYDSQESFFADAAEIWTDAPGNRLVRADGTVLAEAGRGLSLAYLGPRYPDGQRAQKDDVIGHPVKKYREQARRLHEQPQYANRVYGHAVIDRAGDLWLQYWFFYFYNDYNLIGRILKAGLHEGDWEMVQVRLRDEQPDRAVYTQHAHAEGRQWNEVDVVPGTDRPIVYVARGSHAGYFEPGTHWTGHWFDHADAKRKSPQLTLEIVDDEAEHWRWVRWPGSWGDTRAGDNPLDSNSPRSPGSRGHWDDPLRLEAKAPPEPGAVDGRPVPPPAPHVRADWEAGRLQLHYNTAGARIAGLAVTVNSSDEGAPPTTESFPVRHASGNIPLSVPVESTNHYDIYVSSVTREGLASESVRLVLAPEAA
jgi:Vacuolar protein sorting-associated protein 62